MSFYIVQNINMVKYQSFEVDKVGITEGHWMMLGVLRPLLFSNDIYILKSNDKTTIV